MNEKRVYKVRNGVICGVCGGLGEFFGVDPVLIRILWVLFGFLGGTGLLAYIICALLMPYKDQI